MYENVGYICGEVVDLLYLYLALLFCLEDGLDDSVGCLAERYLVDRQCILVYLLDLCTHLHHAASLSLHIFCAVCIASGREVRIKFEILALEMRHACIYDLIEVVWKNLGSETHCNSLCSLCKQKRELDRQFDRLLITSVVRGHPVGCLRVEDHLLGKLGQTGFDVSRSRIGVACKDITPVSLAVYQEILLTQLHEGSEDGLVSMRMVLHGLSDDVGDLRVAAVIHLPHGVENSPLHRLHAVHDMRNGTIQDDIR